MTSASKPRIGRNWLTRLLPALLVASLLTACSSAASAPSGKASSAASSQPASGSAAASSAKSSPSGTAQPAASEKTATSKIVVSYSEVFGYYLPLWIAKEADIFSKNRLDVDLQFIASTTSVPALISGQTQIAAVGGSGVLSAVVSGADLAVIAELGPVIPYLFMAPPSIKNVEDLKGKKVGVSQFGSASDIGTRVALQKLGLVPDKDVTIVQVGSAQNRAAALQSGAIQGAVSQPPESLALEQAGMHTLIDLASLHLPSSNASFALQRTWMAAHRDVVQRFVDSLIQGTALMKQNKSLSINVLEKYYKSTDDKAMQATYEFYAPNVIPSLPLPNPDQYQNAVAQLSKKNEKINGFNVSSMLDLSFVQNAQSRGLGR